jgi:hypothetical protein
MITNYECTNCKHQWVAKDTRDPQDEQADETVAPCCYCTPIRLPSTVQETPA